MADTRLRELERELAAHPTPAARDHLEAERLRRGDRTWLPVLVRDLERWDRGVAVLRVFFSVARALGLPVGQVFDIWNAWRDPPPQPRGRPVLHEAFADLQAIDEAIEAGTLLYQTADGRVRPCEPGETPIGIAGWTTVEQSGTYELHVGVPGEGDPVSLAQPRRRRYGPRGRRR